MTETEKKALALVKAAVSAEQMRILPTYVDKAVLCEALFRAIEQHEAFKREVSDVCEGLLACTNANKRYGASLVLNRFIIAKPDPLVEAINSAPYLASAKETADHIRAAIEARGGRIVWEGDND